MQLIIALRCAPEEYARKRLEHQTCAPDHCPRCKAAGRLKAHDYYRRSTTNSAGQVIAIRVRRFMCRHCGVTVGCLPSFAQPYRLVNSATIEKALLGDVQSRDVMRNQDLLRRYWLRFRQWAVPLRCLLETASGRTFPGKSSEILLMWLLATYDDFAGCTRRLARDLGATCFGQYRCHALAAA